MDVTVHVASKLRTLLERGTVKYGTWLKYGKAMES